MRLLLAAGLLVLAGPALAAQMRVSDAWIRAMPVGIPSGGYFTLHNETNAPVVLTGVESPACGSVMLHKSESQGGMSAMRPVSEVEVAPGGQVQFAPGGYHLMCMKASTALKPGATVPMTLIFKGGAKLTANFAVRDAAGK
jgi:periplasmic copper chaperone A